jgi:D-methionine transport system ATP-binding protein
MMVSIRFMNMEGIYMQIRLKDLKKSYGSLHAVNGISLSIPSNLIYGIIGKSGAGKSTLVRLISLLEKPDAGEVHFDEVRVDNLTKEELIRRRRRVGMIFQNFNLFSSRNAAQNVAYPLEIIGTPKAEIAARVAELLELVGLADRGKAPISTLSGGQKQRVAIARALACNPDILFCDEATSALDPQTTHSILSLLKEIQRKMGLTIVMITHQMEVVRDVCDRVAVLDDGRVVEEGPVTDIFAKPKSDVTKEFLSHLVGTDASSEEQMVQWSSKSGAYILRFRGETTDQPILSQITRETGIDFNIRAGGVQKVGGEVEIGTLIVDIQGSEEEQENVVARLREFGVHVEKEERP